METTTKISLQTPEQESMNYALLREAGIEHIQNRTGTVWTDYNTHDPGINILEVLCYAITDLGYRTNQDIKDLLASHPDGATGVAKEFFTAASIFPNNPLNTDDFKKLILDSGLVRNTWIEKSRSSELPVIVGNPQDNSQREVPLHGLYNIRLELEEHPVLGDLNNNVISWPLSVDDGGTPVVYDTEIAMPFWDEVPETWQALVAIDQISLTEFLEVEDDPAVDYFAVMRISYDSMSQVAEFTVRIKIPAGLPTDSTAKQALEQALNDELLRNDSGSLIDTFNQRVVAAYETVQIIRNKLEQHRNLCEDTFRFKAIRIQEVSLNTTIELDPEADANEVLANLYFLIDRFFAPSVNFSSLDDLISAGKSPEEIFEGPLLERGFISAEELEKLQNKEVIYVSDLMQIIMNIEGVVAVKGLSISSFINNQDITLNEPNCLNLLADNAYRPKLSTRKSNILLFKDTEQVNTDPQQVNDLFQQLKTSLLQSRLAPTYYDIAVPSGENLDIKEYDSVQYHFPKLYHIGEEKLPLSASDDSKAKTKQLKAYLLFFDQLLANYFAQLAHLKELFSASADVAKTYFFQAVYEVPDIPKLLGSFVSLCEANAIDPEDTDAWQSLWEQYTADPENTYLNHLDQAAEDPAVFYERRNRFLDHLLARFSEEFTDYSRLLINDEQRRNTPRDLIDAKIALLQDYPAISGGRGLAFNYRATDESSQPDVWDTENVSGYEKRMHRLLGLKNHRRRHLFRDINDYFETYVQNGNEYHFRLRNDQSEVLLESTVIYTSQVAAEQGIQEVIKRGLIRDYYEQNTDTGGQYYHTLLNSGNEVIARLTALSATESQANAALTMLIDFLTDKYSPEGFHMVEHILLRPKIDANVNNTRIKDTILESPFEEGSLFNYEDLYSFRVSLIFPSEPEKFTDPGFKKYVEDVVRTELPAHIMAHIYWIRREQLQSFEEAWKNWLQLNAMPTPLSGPDRAQYLIDIHTAHTALIQVLNGLADHSPDLPDSLPVAL